MLSVASFNVQLAKIKYAEFNTRDEHTQKKRETLSEQLNLQDRLYIKYLCQIHYRNESDRSPMNANDREKINIRICL